MSLSVESSPQAGEQQKHLRVARPKRNFKTPKFFFATKMDICLDPACDARSDGISCGSTGALRERQQHPPERLWQQLPWPECVPVKTHLWIHTTYSLWCRSRPAASCPSPSATLSVAVSLFKYSGHRRLAKAIHFNPFGFSLALMLHEQCWY